MLKLFFNVHLTASLINQLIILALQTNKTKPRAALRFRDSGVHKVHKRTVGVSLCTNPTQSVHLYVYRRHLCLQPGS